MELIVTPPSMMLLFADLSRCGSRRFLPGFVFVFIFVSVSVSAKAG